MRDTRQKVPRNGRAQTLTVRAPKKASDWLISSRVVSAIGVPPRDPPDPDEDNEEDEEDQDKKDEEPAVIREPDEC